MNQMSDTLANTDVSTALAAQLDIPSEPIITVPPKPQGFAEPQRIAFIHSSWHRDIVMECHAAFMAEIAALGIAPSRVDTFELPGAFEIPLHAQLLARSGRYTAIVAAGLVVDGGIYRHEFVASTVISALMQVQLATCVPIFSAVLTPQQFHEHETHLAFFRQHMLVKGAEAARACAATLQALEMLPKRIAAGIG